MTYQASRMPKAILVVSIAALSFVAVGHSGVLQRLDRWGHSGDTLKVGGITIATGEDARDMRAARLKDSADKTAAFRARRFAARTAKDQPSEESARSFGDYFTQLTVADLSRATDFLAGDGRRMLRDSLDGPQMCVSADDRYVLFESGGAGAVFFKFRGQLLRVPWQTEKDVQEAYIEPAISLAGVVITRVTISGLRGPQSEIRPVMTALDSSGEKTQLLVTFPPNPSC